MPAAHATASFFLRRLLDPFNVRCTASSHLEVGVERKQVSSQNEALLTQYIDCACILLTVGLLYIHSKDGIIIGKTGSAKCSTVEIQSMSRLPFCGMLYKTLYATKTTLDATLYLYQDHFHCFGVIGTSGTRQLLA